MPVDTFNQREFDRGAMTLQALRQKVGDDTFFQIMRTWPHPGEPRHGLVLNGSGASDPP